MMYPKFLKRIVASYIQDPRVTYLSNLNDPNAVLKAFGFMGVRDREQFLSVHLDKGNRLICWDEVAVGGLDSCAVETREVFKTALLSNAASLIFIHNHPSGRAEPSPEDRKLTEKLKDVAKLFNISVLDHIIICGDEKYFSFSEHGLLQGV